MQFVVSISRTTGKNIEETFFDDLDSARDFYDSTLQNTLYKRVLILLLAKPSPYEENIIDVDFIEGLPEEGTFQPAAGQPENVEGQKD